MPLKRVWIPSPNYYVGNSGRRLLVIHSTEGITHWRDLGIFFQDGNRGASSHTGIDNFDKGTIGEYVARSNAAWTSANANGVAVQAELCAPSGASDNWSRDKWMSQTVMLQNCADWLREESEATGIPLTILTPGQAQGSGRGVCQHADLGSWGGGHHDCGKNFPIDYVVNLALGTTPATKPKTDECEDDSMFYLKFGVNADGTIRNDSSVVFTNDQKDGKHRIRFGCRVTQTLRVDPTVGPSWSATIGYQDAEGLTIPKDCNSAVIHVDEPCDLREPIAVSIGKQ